MAPGEMVCVGVAACDGVVVKVGVEEALCVDVTVPVGVSDCVAPPGLGLCVSVAA